MPNFPNLRFWATVSKDASHIRDVCKAEGHEMATILLTSNYTPALKALYDVKPVSVTVDVDAVEAKTN